MTCTHTLWDQPDTAHCVRTDEHQTGHIYQPTTDDLGDHGRHCDETQEED